MPRPVTVYMLSMSACCPSSRKSVRLKVPEDVLSVDPITFLLPVFNTMMLRLKQLLLLLPLALAHTENDISLEVQDLCLPDLASLDILSPPSTYSQPKDNTLLTSSEWEIGGSAEFKEGRIILTPDASTVGVLTNPHVLNFPSWTVEVIFRSRLLKGKHNGALSLKYTKDTSRAVWDSTDGLNVVVDSNGHMGSAVHAFLGDGTTDLGSLGEEKYNEAFGSCIFHYQDSSVPNTLRISYYDGLLVVQANNRVCLRTTNVKLPQGYKVGLVAQSGELHEQFELLRLKTYAGVISEVFENDKIPANQPRYVTKYVKVDEEAQQQEKVTKIPEGQDSLKDINGLLSTVKSSNSEIMDKFNEMQSKILALSGSESNDLSYLDEQNKKIKQLHASINQLSVHIDTVEIKLEALELNVNTEMNKLVNSVNRLNNDLMNQLRDNEHSVGALSGKIEYLVLSEKEREANPVHDLINGLKYLMLPVLGLSLALCFLGYRLRHDIKTKLL